MTVKQLIKHLQNCNPYYQVILSKDAEGNYFYPLSGIDFEEEYIPENTWSGELVQSEEVEVPNCIVLWPTN